MSNKYWHFQGLLLLFVCFIPFCPGINPAGALLTTSGNPRVNEERESPEQHGEQHVMSDGVCRTDLEKRLVGFDQIANMV